MLSAFMLDVWPCGCVNAGGELPPHALWHVAYECSWCGAVVSRPDLLLWLHTAEVKLPPQGITYPLLRVDGRFVEIGGEYGDGSLRVRSLSGKQWYCLQAPDECIEVLRN
jgi:hypothetical protein